MWLLAWATWIPVCGLLASQLNIQGVAFLKAVAYKPWHKSKRFSDAIECYAQNKAQTPEKLEEAVKFTYFIIDEIKQLLAAHSIFVTPEYVGSAFEGLRVRGEGGGQANIEFDVMLVWDFKEPLTIEASLLPNFVFMKSSADQDLISPDCKPLFFQGYLCPMMVTYKFLHLFRSFIENISKPQNNATITVSEHGPALQIDVKMMLRKEKKILFTIDIVPSLKLNNDEYFVPKVVRGGVHVCKDFAKKNLTWRRSFSVHEKKRLSRILKDENHVKLLKVLKGIRNQDAQMALLNSYQLKNIFLRVCHRMPDNNLWSEKYLGLRLMDLLIELEVCLRKRYLPSFFQPCVNLMADTSFRNFTRLANRFRRLIDDENAMMKLVASRC
ncbi:hypothetical protein HELRODRAFT_159975 [Helobdella robusta]|uniref:Uncharacterized protein n=1 Tax=Helobdella robusta TaxID=6412 RepID=T1EPM0_HELRO|nr:hypothetical protein HELRODRAFT_159975 [Helobdella robusta]ESO05889.1 hypothetical protein HELRODRAFT_159975 [Helobdella robusta]